MTKPQERTVHVCVCMCLDLHELERSLKVLNGVHFDSEELHAHDEADDALHHMRTLLLQPQFLQLCDELLTHCLEPAHKHMNKHKLMNIFKLGV